jgi:hypothetical protein
MPMRDSLGSIKKIAVNPFECPAPFGNPLRTRRLERLLVKFGHALAALLDHPTECVPLHCVLRARVQAIAGLGRGGQYTTFFDTDDECWCTLGADALFCLMTAGSMMMLPAQIMRERLEDSAIDNTVAETTHEVFNILSNGLVRELAALTCDPNLAFLRDEPNRPEHLPESPLLVSTADVVSMDKSIGHIQLWFSASRVQAW